MPPSQPSTTEGGSGRGRRAPVGSGGISQYFLLILAGFGVLQFALNLSQGSHIGHQSHSIEEFKRRHFAKSHSKSRKKFAKIKEQVQDAQEELDNYERRIAKKKKILHALEEVEQTKRRNIEQGEDGDDDDESENTEDQDEDNEEDNNGGSQQSLLAGLNCDAHGGPSKEIAREMVYWEDIPSDNQVVSPFKSKDHDDVKYITFESDRGGWNNIRMAMETVLAMALAMGRTLVLPPEQGMYLLNKNTNHHHGKEQRDDFTYNHFFHTEHISEEHLGLKIITMKEFLEREGLAGKLKDSSGKVRFPPNNRTDYDGDGGVGHRQVLQTYLRAVGVLPRGWDPENCLAVFPKSAEQKDVDEITAAFDDIKAKEGFGSYEQFIGKPFKINASVRDRMKEGWADRKALCVYDKKLQEASVLHFAHGQDGHGARLLVHFYAFLFFQDWKQDTWMKRFVRDHVHYIDEIQCAAARVVHALRSRAKERDPSNKNGYFDTLHVRRGDFQYKPTRFEADRILKNIQPELAPNVTLYIATDEKDKSFFKPFYDVYDVVFLDDFHDLVKDVNTNYYGMMDQLIASRGRIFFGCWFSTFTGYINRLRGYHANKAKAEGYEMGLHRSYYYALEDRKFHLQQYWPVKKQFYAREFPTSWRLIDKGIDELDYLIPDEEQEGDNSDQDNDDADQDTGNDDKSKTEEEVPRKKKKRRKGEGSTKQEADEETEPDEETE